MTERFRCIKRCVAFGLPSSSRFLLALTVPAVVATFQVANPEVYASLASNPKTRSPSFPASGGFWMSSLLVRTERLLFIARIPYTSQLGKVGNEARKSNLSNYEMLHFDVGRSIME